MENYYVWLGIIAYLVVGLCYLRIHRLYIDSSVPYKLVGGWFIFPIYLLVSDFFNDKNIIRSRDVNNRPFRAVITKDTKFTDERSEPKEK